MLVFKLNDGFLIEWHVGEKVPQIWQPERDKPLGLKIAQAEGVALGETWEPPEKRFVVEVQADGGELTFIEEHFGNLPMKLSGETSVRWFGDHARFIHANL